MESLIGVINLIKDTPRGKVNWRQHSSGPIRPTPLEIVDSSELLSLRGPEPEGGVTPHFRANSTEGRVARNRKRALEPTFAFSSYILLL